MIGLLYAEESMTIC